MQRILQINIVGRVIPIEEDAYQILKKYIDSIERQFFNEMGKDEIIHDIENRIAELFFIRLNGGAPAIDKTDVNKVIETLGSPNELNDNAGSTNSYSRSSGSTTQNTYQQYESNQARRLFRNPNDKVIGGVCSGVANYFDIDPVIVRLVFAVLFLTAGIGLLAYILAWIIIPAAKSPADLGYMTSGKPMDFNTIQRNVSEEMQDLKKRGEEMSRELKEFFSKKK
jgi:phage shock protein C